METRIKYKLDHEYSGDMTGEEGITSLPFRWPSHNPTGRKEQ